MAVAGEDYVICAADTRMSTGYSIMMSINGDHGDGHDRAGDPCQHQNRRRRASATSETGYPLAQGFPRAPISIRPSADSLSRDILCEPLDTSPTQPQSHIDSNVVL